MTLLTLSGLLLVLCGVGSLLVASSQSAHAYIDPGMVSSILRMVPTPLNP